MEKPKDPAVQLEELRAEMERRDPKPVYLRSAMWATSGSASLLALGAVTPNVEFGSMLRLVAGENTAAIFYYKYFQMLLASPARVSTLQIHSATQAPAVSRRLPLRSTRLSYTYSTP